MFLLCGCSDSIESYYPTKDAALDAGAIDRGWIPAALPDIAVDLREQHDVDTNEVWLRFRIETEVSSFIAELEPLSSLCRGHRLRSAPRWWDTRMKGDPFTLAQTKGFHVRELPASTCIVVMTNANDRFFYLWRPPS